jgi:predicted protein tyrosine phosphatase
MTDTRQPSFSEIVSRLKNGIASNPYQGNDKKVLFVCSVGILRSATAARIYAKKYNTRSAGTYDIALIQVTDELLAWADEIVFVNKENYRMAAQKFEYLDAYEKKIKVLDIPDDYEHMHPKLIEAFEEQYEKIE